MNSYNVFIALQIVLAIILILFPNKFSILVRLSGFLFLVDAYQTYAYNLKLDKR